jgi:heme exporter protein A
MRKRLALARVLLQEPRVALLDEPYGELDPAGFRLVDGVLERFRARGATVLLSTHLVARGRETCDLAVALQDGRIAWSGRAQDAPADAA